MNAQAVAKVVEEEFKPKFQAAGGKIVFGYNYKKLHSDASTFFFEKILFECEKAVCGEILNRSVARGWKGKGPN